MNGLLDGKSALITGAGSGIGRATALAFARDGARCVLSDVDEAGLEESLSLVQATGAEAVARTADVSREPEVEALLAKCIEAFGRLDCAVNNAGITGNPSPLAQMDLANWERVLSVNLTGAFLCLKHELVAMQAQGAGAIVNTSSGAGIVAAPFLSPYCASKHGILGLTKTAAAENARSGVRINAICPGSTDTPMMQKFMAGSPQAEKMIKGSMPGGRLGTPEEIAEAAVWLCSDRASFVNGTALVVDGGAVGR